MRSTPVALAALIPAVVIAAPAAKLATEAAGFTRNAVLPKWAAPLAEIPPSERTDPVVIRLNETQSLVGASSATLYNRAIQVNDSSELGAIGQYALSYFAQYQKLVLHRVMILRGAQRIDRTASVQIRPLQRETSIESGMLGGATTLQLLLDDVRIGDTLWISYTVEGENPVFGKQWASDYNWDAGMPVELRRVTITHPRNRPLQWRQLGDFHSARIEPQIEQLGEMTRMRFEGRALDAVEGEPSVPSDYLPARVLQVTEYRDWSEVAQWANGLFPKLPASPALKTLARQFAAEADPQARAAAALHWVQNEIRYFSVSIGENSHRPQAPDVVLQRRYGDCKDKSYLLVSLLRELGVQAQPVLLSATAPRLAAKLLPSPSWFNHVIVQISIDGRDYFVDPTRINQPEPLATMPIAFPGGQVLPVDAAARGLSTIPERSDSLPTFEHNEEITIADFSGAAILVTRDVYRSTYADGMRTYYTRLSVNEQKKSVLSRYEKLYPGVSLDGVPEYRDVVADNRVEVISRYKLPKAVVVKDKRYQVQFNSQILDGTLGIPSKLVRNFPFELAGGRYSGRYRLRVHWPEQVRRNDPRHVKMLDNPYFQAREEFSLRGSDMDYLVDFRLKQRSVPAAELPALEEQSKLLQEYAEGNVRIEEASVVEPKLQTYSMRDLESLSDSYVVVERSAQLKAKKDAEISLTDACAYVNHQYGLEEFVNAEAITLGLRLEKRVTGAPAQAGMGACLAELWFARGKSQAAIDALAADPLKNDASPLLHELAWAQFYTGDRVAAVATMARYRAARELAAGGMIDAADAASQIALLQRAGQPLPPALEQFARELPDGPWPRPVLAMQLGLLTPEQLLQQAEAMRRDSKALALNEAWFYIGQQRLLAGDRPGALAAFRWLNGNGLRNHLLQRQAQREINLDFRSDRHADAGMKAMLNKDYAGAAAAWREGAAAGNASSQHGLALLAISGQGMPRSLEQARQWLQQAADQGNAESQALLGLMMLYGEGGAKDSAKGLELLGAAGAKGDAKAQYELGWRYRWGDGVKQDYAQALRWLQQAADQGHDGAMAQLGAMYRHAEGVAKDYTQAAFWNQRGAMHGNAHAAYNLGLAVQYGEGLEKDEARAAILFRAAAERGYSDAAVELGLMYETGQGVAQSYAEALSWYRRAAEQGNMYGQKNLGNFYQYGRGVGRDLDMAERYLRQAAEQGHRSAMTALGYLYDRQRQRPELAIPWYEKAAAQRQPDAEFNLALAYEQGRGVQADPVKALEWYRRAAEDGDLDAQYALAQALFYGDNIAQDQAEAAVWYAKSAAQGLASAQGKLGEILLFGWGVPADKSKAVTLLQQAAGQQWRDAYVALGHAYEAGLGVPADKAQAIVWYEKAPDVLKAQVRLGLLYQQSGQQAERARLLLQQADAQSSPAGFASLGRIYRSAGDKTRAEWAYTRGLEMAERDPATQEAYLREYLAVVAEFYQSIYQFEKAEVLQRRQLVLTEKLYDAKSPELMRDVEELGDLYQNLGRYADAEAFYLRVLALKESVYGARSKEMAAMLDSIGGLYAVAEQFDKAVDYTRRALALNEAMDDPALQATLRHLAGVMLRKENYAEAERLLQRSLAVQKTRPGNERIEAATLNTLGVVYDKLRDYDKASEAMERARALKGKTGEQDGLSQAAFACNLASIRIGQQRYAEAEALLQESWTLRTRVLGDNHHELSYVLYAQGRLYRGQQQYAKAAAALQQALKLRESTPLYGATDVAEILLELGEVYRLQGQTAQAEPLLARARDLRARIQL